MILLILLGFHGVGKHYSTISELDQIIRGKLDFILILLANLGGCLLKTSIALSLLALIATSGVWMSRAIWALIGRLRRPWPTPKRILELQIGNLLD